MFKVLLLWLLRTLFLLFTVTGELSDFLSFTFHPSLVKVSGVAECDVRVSHDLGRRVRTASDRRTSLTNVTSSMMIMAGSPIISASISAKADFCRCPV